MRKLFRSTHDRKLSGVCGGIAEYFGLDSTLVRILLVIIAVFSAGSVIIVYIIAAIIIPRDPYQGGGYPPAGRPTPPPFNSYNPNQYGGQGTTQQTPPVTNYAAPPTSSRNPQGIDAMMEDIEKKAMKREIEELKQRLNKFERDSRGE
ncbi:MAG: PspC domain-containing protein [Candidatus Cohnella colombiensis]|uniref:PspC domain-containing protein n=1 Tax=Candidatus Cohnella colombiensis TaxID=3121368 RepID=A0AA95EY56_9BACL|nr:MAG: PspC domain-containing protein [Cohnella sp.]